MFVRLKVHKSCSNEAGHSGKFHRRQVEKYRLERGGQEPRLCTEEEGRLHGLLPHIQPISWQSRAAP
jgi:hypothetical protein